MKLLKNKWIAFQNIKDSLNQCCKFVLFDKIVEIDFDINSKVIIGMTILNGYTSATFSNVYDCSTNKLKFLYEFQAKNIHELLVKLELEGYLYDEPCLTSE